MKTLRYDLIKADRAGIKVSAYVHVQLLEMEIIHFQFEKDTMNMLIGVKNLAPDLPDYITVVDE